MFSGSNRHYLALAMAIVWLTLAWSAKTQAAMAALDDDELAAVTGQNGSLFVSDHIAPNELQGAPADATANFDFYRMGLDVKLNLNLNIAKFQLGCGGVNDFLTTSPGCDLDIDYLGFMGINAAGDRPAYNLANADASGNWGADSAFELIRPYVELAIKNDGSPTLREVVGLKIGAQTINGAMRMGRDYTNQGYGAPPGGNVINRETGGTCVPGATTGAGVVGCHSGLNSISGYLAGLELSAGFRARANICTVLLGCVWPFYLSIPVNLDGCLGRINFDPCSTGDRPFFIDAGGTRLNRLHVDAASLKVKSSATLGQDITGYGGLVIDTRQIHYLLTPNSSGFFLSLQREPVSWPHYEKTLPLANLPYDACNPSYGQRSSRCDSAYAPAANTGWWLSASNAKMLNLLPDDRIQLPGNLNLTQLISLLGADSSPLTITDPKLDFVAAKNCHGTAIFC